MGPKGFRNGGPPVLFINSKKKRNWARSLPSIGDAGSGGYDGVDMSASAPSFQISGTIFIQIMFF